MTKLISYKKEYHNITSLHKRTSLRHKYISQFLYQTLNKFNHDIDQYVLFSIAFLWHCQKYLNIDLFDNIIDDSAISEMLWIYPNITNKKTLKTFIKLSISILKNVSLSQITKAVQKFEEDNGEIGNLPHGFIASKHNVKDLLNNFTEKMYFNLNDKDVSMIVDKLII
jgi:hypothetical protein